MLLLQTNDISNRLLRYRLKPLVNREIQKQTKYKYYINSLFSYSIFECLVYRIFNLPFFQNVVESYSISTKCLLHVVNFSEHLAGFY